MFCVGVASCGPQRASPRTGSDGPSSNQTPNPNTERVANLDGPRQPDPQHTPEAGALGAPPEHASGATEDEPTVHENVAAQPARDAKSTTESAQDVKSTAEPPASGQSIAEICDKLTRRANQKCAKQVAGMYQSTCNHYLQKPGDCAEQFRKAVECQSNATDEALCAHEADPSCLSLNRALKECQRGTALPDQNMAEDLTLPTGWMEIRDEQLGFVVAMPPDAALDAASKHRTWMAQEGNATYYVSEIDPPAGKLNNQAWIRAVIGYVGARCQLHLRLRGELELKGTTVVQFHTGCPDRTEWHGMLHLWQGKAVATAYHAPAGVTGVQEPFFYSFQVPR